MDGFQENSPGLDRDEFNETSEPDSSLADIRRQVDDLLDWEITPDGITLDLRDMEKAWHSVKEVIRSVIEDALSPFVDLSPETSKGEVDSPPIPERDRTIPTIVEAPIFPDAVIVGNPEALEKHWRWQGPTEDCALYAQGQILEALGYEFDIESFRKQGVEGGWYTVEEGTDADALGLLLQNFGVEYKEYAPFEADMDALIDALGNGKGVVVGIETSPIAGIPGGHAVMVTGVEVDREGKALAVICNDSGFEEGKGHRYPVDRFMRAWSNMRNVMIETNQRIVAVPRRTGKA